VRCSPTPATSRSTANRFASAARPQLARPASRPSIRIWRWLITGTWSRTCSWAARRPAAGARSSTPTRAAWRDTEAALESLNVKIPSVRQQVRRLSGGQRQGIAIGRAVHWGSRILIMDEPMAALGLQEAGRVQELIGKLAERGLTQIVVSHNLEHVFTLATRIAIMRLGRLVGVRETAQTDHEEIVHLIAGLSSSTAST